MYSASGEGSIDVYTRGGANFVTSPVETCKIIEAEEKVYPVSDRALKHLGSQVKAFQLTWDNRFKLYMILGINRLSKAPFQGEMAILSIKRYEYRALL